MYAMFVDIQVMHGVTTWWLKIWIGTQLTNTVRKRCIQILLRLKARRLKMHWNFTFAV